MSTGRFTLPTVKVLPGIPPGTVICLNEHDAERFESLVDDLKWLVNLLKLDFDRQPASSNGV